MKKFISITLMVVLVSLFMFPNYASAAWWNPLSWLKLRVSISRETSRVKLTPAQENKISVSPSSKITPQIIISTPKPKSIINSTPKVMVTPTPVVIVTPILPPPPTIDQLKHLYAFCAQSIGMQNLCDKYDAVGQYYNSQLLRDAWNQVIAKYEATMVAQPKNNTPFYLPSSPSFNYNRPSITLGPVPTFRPLPQYTLAPTPKSKSISEQVYQEQLCNSIGGYMSLGECHDGINF